MNIKHRRLMKPNGVFFHSTTDTFDAFLQEIFAALPPELGNVLVLDPRAMSTSEMDSRFCFRWMFRGFKKKMGFL